MTRVVTFLRLACRYDLGNVEYCKGIHVDKLERMI